MSTRVLLVDDDPEVGSLLSLELRRRGFTVTTLRSGEEALDSLAATNPDVLVTDLALGGMTGIELCARVHEKDPDLPVLVITAHGSIERAVHAIRVGAWDFLTKPVDVAALAVAVERAAEHRALRGELAGLRGGEGRQGGFEEFLGDSPAMREVYGLVKRVAASDISVLVTGESGTGKELVARALHQRSRRREGPLVAVNCSAIPEQLMESELFGHVKGAFTDAKGTKPGLFGEAHGGTLFLDEAGELPLPLQPKLLRALQEKRVRPVGGTQEVAVDVRIVSATNVDLERAVRERRFREDLFFRLNVIHIALPPLRERGDDVLVLAQRFLTLAAEAAGRAPPALPEDVARALRAHDWPGNVRELQNCMERAVVLCEGEELQLRDLPERIRKSAATRPPPLPGGPLPTALPPGPGGQAPAGGPVDPASLPTLAELEKRHILAVMEAVGGNKSSAANILGVDRRTLYRKLAAYGQADGAEEGGEE
jgi:two-component system response regulator HydG